MSMLLWLDKVAIISFGFIGGVYFAFSFFIMQSLNKLSHPEDIRAMTSIILFQNKSDSYEYMKDADFYNRMNDYMDASIRLEQDLSLNETRIND